MWSATLQSDKYQILFIIAMASKFLKIFSESSSDSPTIHVHVALPMECQKNPLIPIDTLPVEIYHCLQ